MSKKSRDEAETTSRQIKDGLRKLTPEHRFKFSRMYSHADLNKSMDVIVDSMDDSKLNHALVQVTRSLENLKKAKKEKGSWLTRVFGFKKR